MVLDIVTPSGEIVSIDDPALIKLLGEGINEKNQLKLVRSDRALTDCSPVSLISLQTLRQVESELSMPIDKRRFRANIYLNLASDSSGFAEDNLVGRRLRIGSKARIMVLERDPRCKMISLDPDTSEHNPEVLRKVAQAHSLRFFESFPHHLHEILLACTNNFHILAVAMKHEHSKYCNCLYYSANALARVLTKMAEEEFAVTGLAPSYAFLLMTVNGKPGIQPTEISAHMQLTPSTVTRLIEKMEHRRLLERKSAGKFTQVFPTEKSKKLDKKIREAWMSLYQRYSDVLGEVKGRKLTDEVYQAIEKLTG